MGACLGRDSPAAQHPAPHNGAASSSPEDTSAKNRQKADANFERTSVSKAPNNIGRVSMSSEKAADNKGIARVSRQASARSSATTLHSSPDNAFSSVAHAAGEHAAKPAGKPKPKDDEVWD